MKTQEIWKDVKGYEGYYMVSNTGMVKSLNRKIIMSENILIQVGFNSYRPRKDRSCAFNFISSVEVDSNQIKSFHELLDTQGVLYYKSGGELSQKEIKALDGTEIENEGKSKSQRLRSVLYIYHKQLSEATPPLMDDFNTFYSDKMEQIIQQIKDRLEQ